jgi:hypothetical protein
LAADLAAWTFEAAFSMVSDMVGISWGNGSDEGGDFPSLFLSRTFTDFCALSRFLCASSSPRDALRGFIGAFAWREFRRALRARKHAH